MGGLGLAPRGPEDRVTAGGATIHASIIPSWRRAVVSIHSGVMPPDGLANRACRPTGLRSISGGGLRSRTPNLSVPLVFETSRRPTPPNPPYSGHQGQGRTGVLRFAGGC